jgi:GWxTD domain-containing protein
LSPGAKKIFCFLIILVAVACRTSRQYTSKPSKSIINPDSDLIEVNAVAYHSGDTLTEAFVEIVNENLIYKRPDSTSAFYAELKVHYRLLPEQGSRKIVDSGSYYMNDRALEAVEIKSLKSSFQVRAKMGYNYYLDIQVLDLNKKVKYSKGLNIYKQNKFTAQNFLVKTKGAVSFSNRFVKDEEVSVQIRNTAVAEVTVECFFRDFPPAAPPFSLKSADEYKYKPDSVFTVALMAGVFQVNMPPAGFYHFRTDRQSLEGLTLFTSSNTFPGVSNSEEMINCTRYLMNKDEYETCLNATDQKEAIDKFWITIGGSKERARELLKRYYGRVKEANKYYSSYVPGWKTDRGMIFIIFGLPGNIHRSARSEVWIYGVESNPNSLRYVFNKAKNPFSDNDYILERSQFYKQAWYDAEDVWRQGHVYISPEK